VALAPALARRERGSSIRRPVAWCRLSITALPLGSPPPMDFNPEPSGLNMLCSDMNE
jgi:hypothetical protein